MHSKVNVGLVVFLTVNNKNLVEAVGYLNKDFI